MFFWTFSFIRWVSRGGRLKWEEREFIVIFEGFIRITQADDNVFRIDVLWVDWESNLIFEGSDWLIEEGETKFRDFRLFINSSLGWWNIEEGVCCMKIEFPFFRRLFEGELVHFSWKLIRYNFKLFFKFSNQNSYFIANDLIFNSCCLLYLSYLARNL